MRSVLGFVVGCGVATMACSQTATMATVDASVVADAVDVVDTARLDAVDAADVVDAARVDIPSDDGARTDVGVDVGVTCGSIQTACAVGAETVCVDVRSDPRHCGACGRACCVGEWCAAGTCVVGCSAGMTACRAAGTGCGLCADLRTDPNRCGACDRPCAPGQVCADGSCVATTCAVVTEPPPPMGQCDGRGRIACEMWAQGIAGGRPSVTAQCLTEPSGCAKADRCDDPRDPSTCRCGAEPACGANQVCELVGPTARCRCARP